MAEPAAHIGTSVEELLEERARYQEWLTRLDSAASQAPATVRERVRADYAGRLHEVINQLRAHASSITEALSAQRAGLAKLEAEEAHAQETLAEAALRHAVGEYEDEEWTRVAEEANQMLQGMEGDIANVRGEIARLTEVQDLIVTPGVRSPAAAATPPAPAAPAAAEIQRTVPPAPTRTVPASAEPAMAPQPSAAQPSAPPGGAPRFVPRSAASPRIPPRAPRPTAPSPPSATPAPGPTPAGAEPVAASNNARAVDELAFLKSVSDDDGLAAPPEAPAMHAPPSGATHAPPSGVARASESGPSAGPSAASASIPAPTAAGAVASARVSHGAAGKTLKCGECGTFNRPTEWYCERCGAELAAV